LYRGIENKEEKGMKVQTENERSDYMYVEIRPNLRDKDKKKEKQVKVSVVATSTTCNFSEPNILYIRN